MSKQLLKTDIMEKTHLLELINKYAQYVEKNPTDRYYRQVWMICCSAFFTKATIPAKVLLENIEKLQNNVTILNRRRIFKDDFVTLKNFIEDIIANN